MPIFLIFVVILGSIWAYKTVNDLFIRQPQKEIKFNIVGIVNATNSSIVSIQFECIKFCSNNEQYPENCYEQCAKLGK